MSEITVRQVGNVWRVEWRGETWYVGPTESGALLHASRLRRRVCRIRVVREEVPA